MKDGFESLGRVRAKGIGLLIVTFLAGGLAGGALERVRAARTAPDLAAPAELGWRPGSLPPMMERLRLTADQEAQIMAIIQRHRGPTEELLHEMMPRLRAAADTVRGEIRAVLTPQQLARWDSMRAAMDRREGRMRSRMMRRGRATGRAPGDGTRSPPPPPPPPQP